MYYLPLLVSLLYISLAQAATVTYNWNVGWKLANPDGRRTRPIITINNQWPSPQIGGNVGDTIVVNVANHLGNQSLSIHWHGLPQPGNNAQDGTPMVTACPIIPGTNYTYTFQLTQPGTYWYHSHSTGQYMDGLRGPLIVEDPRNPYKGQYDSEIVVRLSDWYWEQAAISNAQYVEVDQNPYDGSEPPPQSALMNDLTHPLFNVTAGKTYFLRIINMSGFAQMYFHIPGHSFTIIETDGIYTQPTHANDLYLANGQRYGVLMKAVGNGKQNYPVLGSMDVNSIDPGALAQTPSFQQNVTGALVYNPAAPIPTTTPNVASFGVVDDFSIVPYDRMPLLRNVDKQIVLGLSFFIQNTPKKQYRSGFNNVTFIEQKVPTLYTALSAGQDALKREVYGHHTNAHILRSGETVELVINNYDGGAHPIHIHGHQVQLVARSDGVYNRSDVRRKHNFRPAGIISSSNNVTALGFSNSTNGMPAAPMRRDTWTLAPNGYTVIRFRADNPGVWFLHCHMEWHMEAGLLMVLVEDPIALQQRQPNIPPKMQSICRAQNIQLQGNAAGNTQNYTDLRGQVRVAKFPRGADYP